MQFKNNGIYKKTADFYNKKLDDIKFPYKIIQYNKDFLLFSNDFLLTNKNDKKRFLKYVFHSNYQHLLIYFLSDNIEIKQNLEIEIKKIKLKSQSENGKKAWIGDKKEKLIEKMKGRVPWNKDSKGLTISWMKGLKKETDERIMKISERQKGEGNGMHKSKDFWKDTEKVNKIMQHHSKIMKEKIANNEWTPNINNRWTRFKVEYKGKKYRSSWEAIYASLNETAEYEKLRIKYKFENKNYIYIVDFIDKIKKEAIEIKPKSLVKDFKNIAKEKVLIEWCNKNNYTYKLITEDYLKEHIFEVNTEFFNENCKNKIEWMKNEITKKNRNRKI